MSDNGPQFVSSDFKNFSEKFGFEHKTSSPYHSRSNGKAESAVKSAKNLLKKNRTGDQYLALLNFRNTPGITGTSPAQKFFNRRTRNLLPLSNNLLKPKLTGESDKRKLYINQKKQKKNFDKRAKNLTPLHEGDRVVMQPFALGKKTWDKGTVVNRDGRSYDIEGKDGTVYRRNRVHLKKIPPSAPINPPPPAPQPVETKNNATESLKQPNPDPEKLIPPDKSVPKVNQPPDTPVKKTNHEQKPPNPKTLMMPTTSPRELENPSTDVHAGSPSRIPTRTRSGREVKPIKMKDFVYS